MSRRAAVLLAAGCLLAATAALPAQAAPQARPALKPVTHASRHETTFSITLRWHRPADSRVKDVTIRRVAGPHWGGPPTPSWGFPVTTVSAHATSYVVVDAVPHQLYTFAIFARNGSGRHAGYSAPVYLHGRTQSLHTATRFVAVYAAPEHVAFENRHDAIRTDLTEVLRWYNRQTGGRHPLVERAHGRIAVHNLRLPVSVAHLHSTKSGHNALDDVHRALARSHLADSHALVVAYVEGRGASLGECGVDGGAVAVLWMHACSGIYPTTHDRFPFGATYLAAHEMTHALGAVPDCAPHSTGDGHVGDSPRDVLYEGPKPRDFAHLVLDYHHDDYYKTGRHSCYDIAHDAAWVK
jgi:hypothetical protein